jgi:hypothetical protein
VCRSTGLLIGSNWHFDDVTGGLVKASAFNVPLYAPKPELRYDGVVVVLVDQNSAGAGEYFPQFLHYHDRAFGESWPRPEPRVQKLTPLAAVGEAIVRHCVPDTDAGGNAQRMMHHGTSYCRNPGCRKGRLFSFDTPTEGATLTGLHIEVLSSQDIRLATPMIN